MHLIRARSSFVLSEMAASWGSQSAVNQRDGAFRDNNAYRQINATIINHWCVSPSAARATCEGRSPASASHTVTPHPASNSPLNLYSLVSSRLLRILKMEVVDLVLASEARSKPPSGVCRDPGRLFSSFTVSRPGTAPAFRKGLRIGMVMVYHSNPMGYRERILTERSTGKMGTMFFIDWALWVKMTFVGRDFLIRR